MKRIVSVALLLALLVLGAASTVQAGFDQATYVVKPGDTLWSVAQKAGISLPDLMSINGLNWNSTLWAGQTLYLVRLPIPGNAVPPTQPKPASTPPYGQHDIKYAVQPGDSLWLIAHRFGVHMVDIIRVNDLHTPDDVYVGRVLIIPLDIPADANVWINGRLFLLHVVQPGERLWHIAMKHGVSYGSMVRVNGLDDPGRIWAGQKLLVPTDAGSRTTWYWNDIRVN